MKKMRKNSHTHKNAVRQSPMDDVLIDLLAIGVATALAAAPWLAVTTLPFVYKSKKQINDRQMRNTFDYLRRRGYVRVEMSRGRVSIKLTEEGRARAIKANVLRKPKSRVRRRWDGKWRLLLYDVRESKRLKRDVLRHFIRHYGFVQLQGSVWAYPFDCKREVGDLVRFLELTEDEVRFIATEDIGTDRKLRQHFRV